MSRQEVVRVSSNPADAEEARWRYLADGKARVTGAAARAQVTIDRLDGLETEPWIVALAQEYNDALGLTEMDRRREAKRRGRFRSLLTRLAG